MAYGSAAGMWMNGSTFQSLRPASSTSTRFEGSADRRLASAQPADPPPTMTKSYFSLVLGIRAPPSDSGAWARAGYRGGLSAGTRPGWWQPNSARAVVPAPVVGPVVLVTFLRSV